ncbi:MAG: hypothetical protein WC595_01610 [Candidatus Nanoarchaeia archaeon]
MDLKIKFKGLIRDLKHPKKEEISIVSTNRLKRFREIASELKEVERERLKGLEEIAHQAEEESKNKRAEEIRTYQGRYRDYYEELEREIISEEEKRTFSVPYSLPDSEFYFFPKETILERTTWEYRHFLLESGYGNLEDCQGVMIGKRFLKSERKLRELATQRSITFSSTKDGHMGFSEWKEARRMVRELGYRMVPSGIWYQILQPHLIEVKEKSRWWQREVKRGMKEIEKESEWLADYLSGPNQVLVGNKITAAKMMLLETDSKKGKGIHDFVVMNSSLTQLSDFGYPVPKSKTEETLTSQQYIRRYALVRDSYTSTVRVRSPAYVNPTNCKYTTKLFSMYSSTGVRLMKLI